MARRRNVLLYLYVGIIVLLSGILLASSWIIYTCDPRFDPGPRCVFDLLVDHADSAPDNAHAAAPEATR